VTVPPQAPGIVVNVDTLDVPEIRQSPPNPLLKLITPGRGKEPHSTVMAAGAVMVGSVAAFTVIILETGASVLPQVSVAVHVSVTVPPQAPGIAEKVDGLDMPEMLHWPLNPLLKLIVLGINAVPQLTVIGDGAVIVGSTAGSTVMILVTGARALPQVSVADHISVTVPPQGPGSAVNIDGSEVPEIRQLPLNPLLKLRVLGEGMEPHSTVTGGSAVMVGMVAGFTVMVLETGVSTLPQASVAVQVSVIVPPQTPGIAVIEDTFEVPEIEHPPLNPLLYGREVGAGIAPQATVMSPGAEITGS